MQRNTNRNLRTKHWERFYLWTQHNKKNIYIYIYIHTQSIVKLSMVYGAPLFGSTMLPPTVSIQREVHPAQIYIYIYIHTQSILKFSILFFLPFLFLFSCVCPPHFSSQACALPGIAYKKQKIHLKYSISSVLELQYYIFGEGWWLINSSVLELQYYIFGVGWWPP